MLSSWNDQFRNGVFERPSKIVRVKPSNRIVWKFQTETLDLKLSNWNRSRNLQELGSVLLVSVGNFKSPRLFEIFDWWFRIHLPNDLLRCSVDWFCSRALASIEQLNSQFQTFESLHWKHWIPNFRFDTLADPLSDRSKNLQKRVWQTQFLWKRCTAKPCELASTGRLPAYSEVELAISSSTQRASFKVSLSEYLYWSVSN